MPRQRDLEFLQRKLKPRATRGFSELPIAFRLQGTGVVGAKRHVSLCWNCLGVVSKEFFVWAILGFFRAPLGEKRPAFKERGILALVTASGLVIARKGMGPKV